MDWYNIAFAYGYIHVVFFRLWWLKVPSLVEYVYRHLTAGTHRFHLFLIAIYVVDHVCCYQQSIKAFKRSLNQRLTRLQGETCEISVFPTVRLRTSTFKMEQLRNVKISKNTFVGKTKSFFCTVLDQINFYKIITIHITYPFGLVWWPQWYYTIILIMKKWIGNCTNLKHSIHQKKI